MLCVVQSVIISQFLGHIKINTSTLHHFCVKMWFACLFVSLLNARASHKNGVQYQLAQSAINIEGTYSHHAVQPTKEKW